MAFLCPSRLGYTSRAKRNRGQQPVKRGRITGSDSVETIELVGLHGQNHQNTRAKLEIVQDFNPKAPGEVLVRKGEFVRFICTAKDWLYIEKTNGKTGYVPQSVCYAFADTCTELSRTNSVCSSHLSEYSADLSQTNTDVESVISRNMSPLFKPTLNHQCENRSIFDSMDVKPFYKTSHGQYIVLFDFVEENENDISVERSELVEVLNIEDPDWSWVRKYDGLEGFVPKTYICPVEPLRILVKNGGLGRKAGKTNPVVNSPVSYIVSNQPITKMVERNTVPLHRWTDAKQEPSPSVNLDSFSEQSFEEMEKVESKENFQEYPSQPEPFIHTTFSSKKSVLDMQNQSTDILIEYPSKTEFSTKAINSSEKSLLDIQNQRTDVLLEYSSPTEPSSKAINSSEKSFLDIRNQRTENLSEYPSPIETSEQNINSSEKSQIGLCRQNKRDDHLPEYPNLTKHSVQTLNSSEKSLVGNQNQRADDLYQKIRIQNSNENNEVLSKKLLIPETKQMKTKIDEFQNVTDELAKILKKRKQLTEACPSYQSILKPSVTSPMLSSDTPMLPIDSDQNLTTNQKKMSNMVEYVIKYEYKGQSHGQQNIYVQKGEAVYADLNCQNSTEWIWVYIPRTNQYGYIPASYAVKQKTVVL